MPAFVLHQGATVVCAHQGPAQPTASSPNVKVGGKPVVTLANGYTISGCTLPPPPNGNGPCATAQWTTGAATKVFVGRKPVLLATSQAICAPTGTPLQIQSTQTKVQGT